MIPSFKPPDQLVLGFWSNNKHKNVYEVIHIAIDANNANEFAFDVVYRDVKTRRVFTRNWFEFLEKFTLVQQHSSPTQLFSETIRMSRLTFIKMSRENPLFQSHGGAKTFVYLVGDKISFLQSIRFISTKQANAFITWLNKWQAGAMNSWEQHMINESFV